MSAFGDAFAKARSAGKKEFTFNGKRYNTRTKDDNARAAKAKAKPKAKAAAKPKAPAKPKKVSVGDNYKKMAKSPGGVPGKKAKPASAAMAGAIRARGKPGGDVAAKPKKKVSVGDNYKRMAKSPGGVPGKAKPKAAVKAPAAKKPARKRSVREIRRGR